MADRSPYPSSDSDSSEDVNMDVDMDADDDLDDIDREVLDASGDNDSDSDMDAEADSDFSSSDSQDSNLDQPTSHPLLDCISLEELNDEGYINLETIFVNKSFGYAKDRAVPAARWRQAQSGNYIDTQKTRKVDVDYLIHPIFQPDKWAINDIQDISTGYWDKLKPVLQLATLLLEEETQIGYTIGMLDKSRHQRVGYTAAENRVGQKLSWFQKRDNPGDSEKRGAWTAIMNLSHKIWWDESTFDGQDLHARTGEYKSGWQLVELNKIYIEVLCRGLDPSDVAVPWEPGTDKASAVLRIQVTLAITMVHEIMHALWQAENGSSIIEPFYRDTREAELGAQWEQIVFSGMIESLSTSPCCPYGLRICTFPNNYEPTNHRDALMSHKKWGGHELMEEYGVEMSFIQGLFTHGFWQEVDRYGLDNFRPARRLGARFVVKGNFWNNESPTIMRPLESPGSDDSIGLIRR